LSSSSSPHITEASALAGLCKKVGKEKREFPDGLIEDSAWQIIRTTAVSGYARKADAL